MKKNSRYKVARNDPSKAGQLAGRKRLFGFCSRYAVYPVHVRGGGVTWFVADSHIKDDITSGPAVIRQGDSEEEVIAGLE